ncbi:MAG: hypothetical protein A4E53_02771 [Pelotomaculum sp. PtaB.Bin104]|nr:MAG: hypothetical protein A4E53_02771 [Pelotomaculum sp. PtaB.Bin104]
MRQTCYQYKSISVVAIVLCTLLLSPPQTAAFDPKPDPPIGIQVLIDGALLQTDVDPVIENGRTLLPLRAILEAVEATVAWDDADKSVTACKGSHSVKLQIGHLAAFSDDKQVMLEVPPKILNGRTMVPVRFVVESLGAKVDWDEASRSVLIATSGPSPQSIPASADTSGSLADVNYGGGVYTDQKITPNIVISFDDYYSSVYEKAFPMFQAAGIKGTIYVYINKIYRSEAATLKQLHEMYDAGWDISNHTINHTRLTDVTDDQIIAEVGNCSGYLFSQGFTRSAYHLSYPFSARSQHTMDLVKSVGINTARSTYPGIQYNRNGIYDIPVILSLDKNTTIHDVHDAVDQIISTGGTGFICGHEINDGPVTRDYAVSTEVLQELVNYIVAKRVEVLTVSEWHAKFINP